MSKILLALTREQLQASLNWQSCVANINGSETSDLWFQFCFLGPQFSGKWKVWGKLLDNWQLPEDALYLSHILLSDTTWQHGNCHWFRSVKRNLQERSFPHRHLSGIMMGLPLPFSQNYRENENIFPVVLGWHLYRWLWCHYGMILMTQL